MMNLLGRTNRWIARWRAAAKLGISFTRQREFRCPDTLTVNGKTWKLTYPNNQPSVHSDFMNVIIDDDYGVKKLTRPKMVIVDIGANIGLFSFWAGVNHLDATIHAYEPNPAVLSYLEANLSGLNAHVHRCGVGGRSGSANLEQCQDITCQTVQFSEDGGNIAIRSLTEVVATAGGFVDVLKMDCEGFEWDIFNDVSAFRQIGEIRMEYHLVNGKTLDDLRQVASTIGFDIIYLSENSGFGIAWLKKRN